MKITKKQLRRIIRESYADAINQAAAQSRAREKAEFGGSKLEIEAKQEMADLMSSKLFANASSADKAAAEKQIMNAVMSLEMNGGQERYYEEFLDDALGGYGSDLQQRLATAAGSNVDAWGEALAAWGGGYEDYEEWM